MSITKSRKFFQSGFRQLIHGIAYLVYIFSVMGNADDRACVLPQQPTDDRI